MKASNRRRYLRREIMSEAILPSYDSAASNKRRRFLARLFEPVSIAPLVQFRIALGAILLWEAYR
ncbi:MAG: hypothetical protein M3552_15940, partial [Planctomycetota bacterium]|nr:hypothetical protein [Planctomycetota bacterium]